MGDLTKYLEGIDIIYYINLDRAVERRKNMEELLSHFNIPNVRISAVDGKNISDDELYSNFIFEGEKNRTKVEYACLLSHFKAFLLFQKSISEGNNYKNCLILEDDMTLEYAKYWDKPVSIIIKEAPTDWGIIMMTYITLNTLTDLYTKRNDSLFSTAAYIININAVNNILSRIYDNNKFKLLNGFFHTADDYIFSLLITYCYKFPYFIHSNANDSTIHSDHLEFHNKSKKKTFGNTWGQLEKITNDLTKYLDGIDIICWINLDRSVERRKNMEELLSHFNIPNVRISAVDGKNISDDELYSNFISEDESFKTTFIDLIKNNAGFGLSKIEYACLLSHLKTYKLLQKIKYKNALILEDDMTLEYAKYWDKPISTIIKDAPKDWEILMLNYIPRSNNIPIDLNKLYILNTSNNLSKMPSYCSA